MTALAISLPLPPSANALFKNLPKGGRAKTAAYTGWLERAGYEATMAHRVAGFPSFSGPLRLVIHLGLRGRRRDAGNCLKAIEDVLVKSIPGLPDDRWNDSITIERNETTPEGVAHVMIAPLLTG